MPVHSPDLDWTAERALALPADGNRYEVLDGELFVTPAPSLRHQSVLARLFRALDGYVQDQRLGWLLWSPAEIVFPRAGWCSPTSSSCPRATVVRRVSGRR